jgi:hypothetical protein
MPVCGCLRDGWPTVLDSGHRMTESSILTPVATTFDSSATAR